MLLEPFNDDWQCVCGDFTNISFIGAHIAACADDDFKAVVLIIFQLLNDIKLRDRVFVVAC
ncbi:hypothetical protein D3C78_1748830 [compost metagenome]